MSDTTDTEKKQIKNRLAVFEHVPCKEKKSNSKSLSFKRNFKRSLSPSSDTELVIDDDYYSSLPQKKKNRGVRMLEEPLKLTCGWQACLTVYEDYRSFIRHIEEHVLNLEVKLETFTCMWESCGYSALSEVLLRQHVCFHGYHSKLKNIGNNVLERTKLPKCTQINEFLITIELNGYSCDWSDCGVYFMTVYEFHEHIRLHVNSNPKYCKKGEVISCCWRGCNSKFTSQYKLADHLRSHTKEKVVACPTCGCMFATKTKFHDHRKRQLPSDMQSYQCSQCSKFFPSERLLRDHMRSHINHYKCTMCDMTCPKPSALATHIRYRHLTERPLKCNLCEHTCVSKQALESHLITHCSEKLLACEECDFRCRSLYGLDRHYHNAHGQGWTQTYECHCCQKRFSRGNKLTKHLIKEHDFHWPSGHSRFKYKEDTDGIYRLQTVRYESIEVTQEMMRTNSNPQPTEPITNTPKYNLKKQQQSSDKPPNYVLMVAENGEQNVVCPTNNSIVITINDVDDRGNILNSEILQSNEMKIMESNTKKEETRNLRSRKICNKN